ncbi:hypothetical protein [Paenibacillus sp. 1781tsa1]|uniref:hypothetical protein n=1 Tax=Paenibacillus sp. 1781tsa1 TaxID=2953810 RepID=UPI0020A03C8F|nr:hypothetical protein [Paenibacillus sp. 1781tsa1]MCP1185064.1 hypothetical protein [Paenibacillus sp. 1781tsa1]
MISTASYKAITKTVKKVIKKLEENDISFEVQGDEHSFAITPTCTINTQLSTIEIHKNKITVNEKEVKDLDEMMEIIDEAEFQINF